MDNQKQRDDHSVEENWNDKKIYKYECSNPNCETRQKNRHFFRKRLIRKLDGSLIGPACNRCGLYWKKHMCFPHKKRKRRLVLPDDGEEDSPQFSSSSVPNKNTTPRSHSSYSVVEPHPRPTKRSKQKTIQDDDCYLQNDENDPPTVGSQQYTVPTKGTLSSSARRLNQRGDVLDPIPSLLPTSPVDLFPLSFNSSYSSSSSSISNDFPLMMRGTSVLLVIMQ